MQLLGCFYGVCAMQMVSIVFVWFLRGCYAVARWCLGYFVQLLRCPVCFLLVFLF